MKVIRADVAGWCFGVKRAVSKALEALQKQPQANGGRVYSLGALIHNKTTLDMLSEKGLTVLKEDAVTDIEEGSTVIIRAHGTDKRIMDVLLQQDIDLIDATCPRVRASQKIAARYARRGYTVIFAGEKGHAETQSVLSYAAGGIALVVKSAREAAEIFIGENAVLLAQTTFNEEEFRTIAEVLRGRYRRLVVSNTICPATRARQEALEELCSEADGVLVVGDRQSANTRRLQETAARLCARAVLVEGADNIPVDFFQLATVGITAGASTPESMIDEVEGALG